MNIDKNIIKRARHLVKGLEISWIDDKPLDFSSGTIDGKVTHKNPVLRHKASQIMQSAGQWILSEARLKWCVTACVVFRHEKFDRQEEIEFNHHGKLCDMNETFQKEIASALETGKNHMHTKISVQCVGV